MNKNQNGFSVVEVVLVILLVGIVGVTGWIVWRAKQKSDNSLTANNLTQSTNKVSTTTNTSKPAKPGFILPAGWVWYENKDLGFKFAYPEVWGQLKTADKGSLLLNLYTDQYTDTALQVDGRINLTASDKTNFTFSPQKYSVILKPVGDGTQWQITDVNPAVADKYKIGDLYELQGKQNVNGGVLYLLSTTDEGCKMIQYLFVLKNSFALLNTPSLCSQAGVSAANETAFDKTTADIVASVSIN